MKWVQRNTDKPHRCPSCHGIALRAWDDHRGTGPRTILHCPRECGVRWRAGYRARREAMWQKQVWR